MRDVLPWHDYFMRIAHTVAIRSKDPVNQIGCVLTKNTLVVSTGYNGFIAHTPENDALWETPTKFDYVVSAEANAVANAARLGVVLYNATAYTTFIPNLTSLKLLISAGMREIIYDEARTNKHLSAESRGMKQTIKAVAAASKVVLRGLTICQL